MREAAMTDATILIVPGLRGHVADHWQTLLEERLRAGGTKVCTVPPMGRTDLECAKRVAAIEEAAQSVAGPVVLVAHSGGAIMVAHWAQQTQRAIHGALLATPPDFEEPMPSEYPSMDALRAAGWLPVPREPLPFPSIVAASRNDPLARIERVAELAKAWGSRFVDLGAVGHLNPASGYGQWLPAVDFIRYLCAPAVAGATRANTQPSAINVSNFTALCSN
jgi:predicted alpha/beta hydrolase family esterase